MSRTATRTHIATAARSLLEPDERLIDGCEVWMADRRRGVPLAFTGRAIYLVAVTDRRLLVFDTPRRGRPLLESDLLLQRPFDGLRLRRTRRLGLLLQVRLSPAPEREVVLEFRPRDHRVGRALVDALRRRQTTNGATTEQVTTEHVTTPK